MVDWLIQRLKVIYSYDSFLRVLESLSLCGIKCLRQKIYIFLNKKKYLDRIKIDSDVSPDLESLKKLHVNHLYNIPFENLDIHYNKRLILNPDYLQEKILESNRGGYCYELNGLFFLLLKELGFNAKMISARVNNAKGGWGEEFDHLAIIVELDELWLADIGFGDSFIEPLKFELDTVQKNVNGYYKIEKYDEEYYKLSKSTDGNEFFNDYIFTLKERQLEDFVEMNNYQQTSPDSHFRKGKVCTIANKKGRVTLSDHKLIITDGDERFINEIKDENEFKEKLLEHFGIEM